MKFIDIIHIVAVSIIAIAGIMSRMAVNPIDSWENVFHAVVIILIIANTSHIIRYNRRIY